MLYIKSLWHIIAILILASSCGSEFDPALKNPTIRSIVSKLPHCEVEGRDLSCVIPVIDADLERKVKAIQNEFIALFGEGQGARFILTSNGDMNKLTNNDQTVAFCVEETKAIYVSKRVFKTYPKMIIFHELAHCAFGLRHDASTRPSSLNLSVPYSLMFPNAFPIFEEDWPYYIEELRGRINQQSY